MTAAAAEAKNNNSNKQTEYKLIVVLHDQSYNSPVDAVPKKTVYYMKYDRQSMSLFYGLLHTNRTNWPTVTVWRQITPKGRCWNPALFFSESDRVDPCSRIYRSLSQPLRVDKAFGEDTASWVSWVSVSMNICLDKVYLSGLPKHGMHTSRFLTDFMTCYVWHSTRYPSSEQREMFSWE